MADNSQSYLNRMSSYVGLGRALAGALIFAAPLLMTMEMWFIGFYMDRGRLALFMVTLLPLLIGLSRYIGFDRQRFWIHDILSAGVALTVGFVTSAMMLILFAVLNTNMSFDKLLGQVAIQAVPASIGALLARSILGASAVQEEEEAGDATYGVELFL